MSQPAGAILLVGVGNVLLGDEGVGIHVARELAARQATLPRGTRVLDGGTLGLDLLPLVADADAVVFVDAVDTEAPPGTITVFRDEEIVATLGGRLGPHQLGIADLVATARLTGMLPARMALVGIQPSSLEVSLELTPAVRGALPLAVEAAQRELLRASSAVV